MRVLERNKSPETPYFSKSIEKLIRYFSKKFPDNCGLQNSGQKRSISPQATPTSGDRAVLDNQHVTSSLVICSGAETRSSINNSNIAGDKKKIGTEEQNKEVAESTLNLSQELKRITAECNDNSKERDQSEDDSQLNGFEDGAGPLQEIYNIDSQSSQTSSRVQGLNEGSFDKARGLELSPRLSKDSGTKERFFASRQLNHLRAPLK